MSTSNHERLERILELEDERTQLIAKIAELETEIRRLTGIIQGFYDENDVAH